MKNIFYIFLIIYIFSSSLIFANSFGFPLKENWNVTQDFNVWNSNFGGYHLGEDVLMNYEAPVYATSDGIVMHVKQHTSYGFVIVIQHQLSDDSYVCSVYGHLRAKDIITEGAKVKKGQLIGYLSSNPNENGGYNFTHLHFGIRSGQYNTNLDSDGEWRYRGYGPAYIVSFWYNPSDFVNSHSATGSLAITNPLSGYTWNYNSNVKVEWNYSGFTGNIAVDIYKGGEQKDNNLARVVSSVPVSQKYVDINLANLPNGIILEPGNDYKIGISATPTGEPWNFSDFFAIRRLTIIYPNGGQIFNPGQVINIKWNSEYVSDNIAIDLYNGEINSARLSSGISVSDNNKNVTIPISTPYGTNYRIAISSYSGYVWDFSDNNFVIAQNSNRRISLYQDGWGWWTGHYFFMDSLSIYNNGIIFEDNFDNNIIDKSKWTSEGDTVIEQQQIMQIYTDKTDKGGYVNSRWINIDTNFPVIIERKCKAHYSNSYHISHFRVNWENEPEMNFGLDYGHMYYSDTYLHAVIGTAFTRHNSSPHQNKDTANVSYGYPVIWDQWFKEKIIYYPNNGNMEYYVNGALISIFNVGTITSVNNSISHLIPNNFVLYQNYPNPFNPVTTIEYDLPEQAKVIIDIYNTLGERVKILENKTKEPGSYKIRWDAEKFSSGVYFYRFTAHGKKDFTKIKKMILLK